MVNDDRPDVRANRLTLLEEIAGLFMSFADFSQIQIQKT
jgi:glycyl-tRNA synthetase beta subunit